MQGSRQGLLPPKVPYAWQIEAAKRALDHNIIVNVDTGCGKTLVAILAIDEALRRFPGKKCAFIVTVSRLLAHQQFIRLRDEQVDSTPRAVAPERVVEVTGYTAGFWGEREWTDCSSRCDVFVGTAEVFRRAFEDKGYLRFDDFSLIVIDECHHARGDSPIVQLLVRLHGSGVGHLHRPGQMLAPSLRTRVLGLTASFASGGAKTRHDFERERIDLENSMQAKLDSCPGSMPREEPSYKRIAYCAPNDDLCSDVASKTCNQIWNLMTSCGVESKDCRKATIQLGRVLVELGRDAFLFALQYDIVAQIQGLIDNYSHMTETKAVAVRLTADLQKLQDALPSAMQMATQSAELYGAAVPAMSSKLEAVVGTLRPAFAAASGGAGSRGAGGHRFCGLVFVQEVSLAAPLAFLLRREMGITICVASGIKSMREGDRNAAFDRFREGRAQMLVCTNCAEEGVDVSACEFVVRFTEIHTARSHVQGAGRARMPSSTVYYLENDPEAERNRASLMKEVAAREASDSDPTMHVTAQLALLSNARLLDIPDRHPFVISRTGAEVNLGNARNIFITYVSKVTHYAGSITSSMGAFDDAYVDPPSAALAKQYLTQESASGRCQILLPGPDGGCIVRSDEAIEWLGASVPGEVLPEDRCAYVGALVLHSHGWLDEHNNVPREVVKRTVWPLPPENIPRFRLRPGRWRPSLKAILGGIACEEDADESARVEKARRVDESGQRMRDPREDGVYSQQERLGARMLSPAIIYNTQATVNRTFSNGHSVLHAMVDLAEGKSSVDDFPSIRVALHPEAGTWHSADNRRLFMLKVVQPLISLESIKIDVINWTSELDAKIDQIPRFGDVWITTGENVAVVRQAVKRRLDRRKAGLPDEEETVEVVDEELANNEARILQSLITAGIGEQQRRSAAWRQDPSMSQVRVRPAKGGYVAAAATDGPPAPMPVGLVSNGVGGGGGGGQGGGTPQDSHRGHAPGAQGIPEHDPRLLACIAADLRASGAASDKDPVSKLNLVMMKYFRPGSGRAMPLFYDELPPSPAGFIYDVSICGRTFRGKLTFSKKGAKSEAAKYAISTLVNEASLTR